MTFRSGPLFDGPLGAFLHAAPDAIVVVGTDGRILAVNPLLERMFGWTREELLGREVEVLVPERYRVAHVKDRLAYARDPRTRPMGEGRELSGLRRDGSEFPVEISLSPLKTDTGTVVVSIVRDVGGRRDAEARFRGLLESAPDGIIAVDREGAIVLVNGQAERMFGYQREELVGKPVELLVPDRFRPGHVHDRDAYAKTPRTRPMGAGRELTGRRKDGTEFPVEISLSPLDTPQGRLVTAIARDITERVEMERRRRLAEAHAEQERLRAQHAEEAVRLRDEFLAIASHELKTPITSIQLQLQSVATRAEELDPKVLAKIERAGRSVERLAALVDTLLDVSRISGGRLHLRVAPVTLDEVVREAVERLRSHGTHAGCDLKVELAPGLSGRWDRLRIEQVLTNLLSNAFKYGAGRPVEVRSRREGDEALLSVTDHGPGIAPEDVERIFGRFERASSVRHFGGLGLGLYISRQIVSAHGGTIAVESRQGEGSTFTVRLPSESAGELLILEEGRGK